MISVPPSRWCFSRSQQQPWAPAGDLPALVRPTLSSSHPQAIAAADGGSNEDSCGVPVLPVLEPRAPAGLLAHDEVKSTRSLRPSRSSEPAARFPERASMLVLRTPFLPRSSWWTRNNIVSQLLLVRVPVRGSTLTGVHPEHASASGCPNPDEDQPAPSFVDDCQEKRDESCCGLVALAAYATQP